MVHSTYFHTDDLPHRIKQDSQMKTLKKQDNAAKENDENGKMIMIPPTTPISDK